MQRRFADAVTGDNLVKRKVFRLHFRGIGSDLQGNGTLRAERAIFRNDRLTIRAVATTEHGFTPGVEASPITRVGPLHLNGHPVLRLTVDASRTRFKKRLNGIGHGPDPSTRWKLRHTPVAEVWYDNLMDVWGWLQAQGATFWQGVERLSWVIAITLLPLGLVQLWFVWREQKRIVAELTKQPDLRVGFFSSDRKLEDVVYVVTEWDAATNRSAPIELSLFSHNFGARTSHNSIINLIFPKDTLIMSSRATGPTAPDMAGGWRVWDKQPVTHPDVHTDLTTTLTAARSLEPQFDIGVTVSMDDQPTVRHVLKVKFLSTSSAPDIKKPEPDLPSGSGDA